jgi:hypothetical protein
MRMSAEFLPDWLTCGTLDQFERRIVHRRAEFLVAFPVAVGFLDDDAALEQKSLQHLVDVELRVARLAHAERDVFEIAEQGEVADFGLSGHVGRQW